MSFETLFTVCNTAVLPGWLLLLVAPHWPWTTRLIASVILPGLMGLVYVFLIATGLSGAEGGFSSLAEVGQLFSKPNLLLAGWVHYLAFDLFVGCWEVRDAQKIGLSHWFVVPCLLLTFIVGPTGLLLYFVLRGAVKQRYFVET